MGCCKEVGVSWYGWLKEFVMVDEKTYCAWCQCELHELDFVTDKEHPACHRCCDSECLYMYSRVYPGKGWMVTK